MVKKSKSWLKERGQYYDGQITRAISDRSTIITNRATVRDLYFKEPGGFDSDTPWEGASDIHLPMIMEKIETATPKITSAMWRADPFVHVKLPNGNNDLPLARRVERFTTWAFRNDIPNFYSTWENFTRNRLLDGTAFAKIRWERKWRKTVEVHRVKRLIEPGELTVMGSKEEVGREKTIEEMLGEIFGLDDVNNSVFDFKKKANGNLEVSFTEEARIYKASVEITEGDYVDELKVRVLRDVIQQDSPSVENVDLENIVFPFRSPNLQDAKWVAQKTWLSKNEVEQKKKSGEWNYTKSDLKAMLGQARNEDAESSNEAQKDEVVGESGNTGTEIALDSTGLDPNYIPVWEVYIREFDEGTGNPIDMIIFLPYNLRKVVGVMYLDEVFPHGRRPFVSDTYIPVDGRIYGIGMAEVLFGINLSLDKTINDVNNAMAVKANPWFMYSIYGLAESASILDGIRPGEGIPVGDVNQVMFPDFAQDPQAMFHASFSTLQGYADTLTFSPSIGGSSNYRNAPRTARGTLALMDQAEEKLSSLVEQSQAGAWKEMVRQVIHLYGEYVGVSKWYHVTGEDRPRRIAPKELRNNFMYEFSGSLTSVNRDVQRQLVERKFHSLINLPLYQQDPNAALKLVEEYLNAFTEGGNYDSQMPKLPGQGGISHPVMDQEVELMSLQKGLAVEVLHAQDDHMQHIKVLEKFRASPAFETIPQYGVAAINFHETMHKNAMMQQQQQAMQANIDGTKLAQQQPQGGTQPMDPNEAGAGPQYGGEMSALEGGAR